MKEVLIDTEYITLGQFLKLVELIQSGGQAKIFLQENKIYVNNDEESRRGRKLYLNDKIQVEADDLYIIKKASIENS